MTHPEVHSPALLLANSAWLHRLTRKLVRDADLAEDVGQEALLAGLASSDSARAGPSRRWLAGVARNVAIRLARRETRRQQVERDAQPQGPEPDTADMVAEAELQSRAVQALLKLRDPYRSALLARFMHGLSSREIARRSRVPVETVRTRVKRGLAMLRSELDRKHGGRRGWLAPIGLPALYEQSTSALWGIVLMNTKTKVLLAASLVLAGLIGIWYVSSPQSTQPQAPRQNAEGITVQAALPSQGADSVEPTPVRTAVVSDAAEPTTASLLVRVVWQDTGEPAADVGLSLIRPVRGSIGQLTSTGSDGTALFETVQPGEYRLNMDRRTGASTEDLELAAGDERMLTLQVPRGVDVRGIVVDPDSTPVGDATILVAWGGYAPQWMYPTTRTSPDGTFFLRSVGDHNMIGARAPGLGVSDFTLAQTGRGVGGEVVLRLVLPGSSARLIGTVYDAEQRPVPGAWVQIGGGGGLLSRPDGSAVQKPPDAIRHTDPEGAFDVDSLQPGRQRVSVYGEGHAPWSAEVELAPNDIRTLRIQLDAAASIAGQVANRDGEPLGGVTVRISGLHPLQAYVISDAQGRYRIDDLPGGEHEVRVEGGDHGNVRQTLSVSAGQETRWDPVLEPGVKIMGILEDARGEALVGWWLFKDDGSASAVTDDAGRFSFNNSERELTTLRVYGEFGFVPMITTIEVLPGIPEQTFTVPDSAMPSARIVGRILTPEGMPAVGSEFYLSQVGRPIGRTPETDADGRFEFGPLPPGTYLLSSQTPGCVWLEYGELVLAANQVLQLGDRQLEYGAGLEVNLEARDQEQLEGLTAEVLDAEGRSVQVRSVRAGAVIFRPLRPGSYELSVKGPNISSQRLPIELRVRETLSVRVDLR